MSTPDGYTCDYCGNIIKREVNFLKHRCKEMIRSEELRSVRGQHAYDLYTYWLQHKRRGNHNIKTFGQSKLFTSFYKFAKWSSNVKLPDKKLYIRFMNLKNYPPSMWIDNSVYIQFLDWIDAKWNAEDHFRQTYNTLKRIAEVADCKVSEALGLLHPNEVLVYVRARKLSPWVLLKMDSFRTMFVSLTDDQRLHFQQTIRPMHWKRVFEDPAKQEENYIIKEAVKRAKL